MAAATKDPRTAGRGPQPAHRQGSVGQAGLEAERHVAVHRGGQATVALVRRRQRQRRHVPGGAAQRLRLVTQVKQLPAALQLGVLLLLRGVRLRLGHAAVAAIQRGLGGQQGEGLLPRLLLGRKGVVRRRRRGHRHKAHRRLVGGADAGRACRLLQARPQQRLSGLQGVDQLAAGGGGRVVAGDGPRRRDGDGDRLRQAGGRKAGQAHRPAVVGRADLLLLQQHQVRQRRRVLRLEQHLRRGEGGGRREARRSGRGHACAGGRGRESGRPPRRAFQPSLGSVDRCCGAARRGGPWATREGRDHVIGQPALLGRRARALQAGSRCTWRLAGPIRPAEAARQALRAAGWRGVHLGGGHTRGSALGPPQALTRAPAAPASALGPLPRCVRVLKHCSPDRRLIRRWQAGSGVQAANFSSCALLRLGAGVGPPVGDVSRCPC